ncbi:MAG: FAD-dependent 5-carboxymethylaminomethyl-2-thiouridine(34) oxidoreductase MnmC [Neisseriaceae bacterium]|nr:FAD-dependent 5-carboxymethylaminomethyl-2-thiouridine(34) oxidoreductase MnmC [Neisseriaceae bacterium]
MTQPMLRAMYEACAQDQATAAEWVWHLPDDLALTTLASWLAYLSTLPLNRPLQLWLRHGDKQSQPTGAATLFRDYLSAAPGLNTLIINPNLRLSLWLGEGTPQWPALAPRTACYSLRSDPPAGFHPLEPNPTATPPWYAAAPASKVQHVCIVGAGIAGASTAYALATQGVKVTVLEQGQVAGAASGNRQGLIYAKISPHLTEQSQLLLSGYGFTLRLLHALLPERQAWDDCGVLHLDVTAQEQKRNQALARWPYPELFTPLSQAQASARAGLSLPSGGLFWPQGAWLHPPSLIAKLLAHPNIQVHEQYRVSRIEHGDGAWRVSSHQGDQASHSASHLVLCQGHLARQFLDLQHLPLTPVRGQVTHRPRPLDQAPLRIALSGHSYVSPPWQDQYCFGASFQAHVTDTALTVTEEAANLSQLDALCPDLAQAFGDAPTPAGKAAIRCDSHDHLPVVGPIGPRPRLQADYAELAIDKTRAIATPCSFYPNLYVNTAHGTRGLATAPLCGFAVAHELLGHSSTLSDAMRQALHPHRFWIRQIIRRQG